jgi:hypothetical protein
VSDTERPPRELARVQRRELEPQVADDDRAAAPPGDAPRIITLSDIVRDRKVKVTALIMIGAQIWWMAIFLSHSFFRRDDFYFLERALSNGLTWKYLMWMNAGKLTPVGFAISWFTVRLSPMDWTMASAVTLVLLAWADLALLRLLRTLFGDHPGILLLLLIYLISPVSLPGLSWWSVTLELLPLEIGIFNAVNSHIRYVRTGNFRYVLFTAWWLLFGMASSIKGAGVPFLLLALTSGWLVAGSWGAAFRLTMRKHWRAWTAYAVVLAAYAGVYALQAAGASQKPQLVGAFGDVFSYVRVLIANTFVPAVLGGPWTWFTAAPYSSSLAFHGEYGIANPPAVLVRIAWVVAAAIIGFSIWRRPSTWRLWAIVLGWLILVDAVPALLGRGYYLPSSLLGRETRYVMDGLGVLVICAGLAFLPLAGERRVVSIRRPAVSWYASAVAVGLATAVVIGTVVSYHDYLARTSNQQARSYFATAQAALGAAPPATVVVNGAAPLYVTDDFSGPSNDAALFGPLRDMRGIPPFIARPDGTYNRLLMFNGFGQLAQAIVAGGAGASTTSANGCFPIARSGTIVVSLGPFAAGARVSELRFGYIGLASGQAVVTYAGQAQVFDVRKGLNAGFLPVHGEGSTVTFAGMGSQLCVGDVEAGVLSPSSTGPAIPSHLLPG